jgi:hypothetical protein
VLAVHLLKDLVEEAFTDNYILHKALAQIQVLLVMAVLVLITMDRLPLVEIVILVLLAVLLVELTLQAVAVQDYLLMVKIE